MRQIAVLFLILMTSILICCSSSPDSDNRVVGSWFAIEKDGKEVGQSGQDEYQYTFNSNNTYAASKILFNSGGNFITGHVGAYRIVGDNLILNPDVSADDTSTYENFADIHWIEGDTTNNKANLDSNSYRGWLLAQYGTVDDTGSVNDFYFTHRLPSTKTDQYYEMIGKYDQFLYGWDDADYRIIDSISFNRLKFLDMRITAILSELSYEYTITDTVMYWIWYELPGLEQWQHTLNLVREE